MNVPTLQNGGVSRDGLTVTYHLRKMRQVERWRAGDRGRREVVVDGDHEPRQQRRLAPRVRLRQEHRHAQRPYGRRSPQAAILALRQHLLRDERPADAGRARARACRSIRISIRSRSMRLRPSRDGPFNSKNGCATITSRSYVTTRFFMGRPHLTRIEIKMIPDENTTIKLLKNARDRLYVPGLARDLSSPQIGPRSRPGLRQRERLRTRAVQQRTSHPGRSAGAARDRIRDRKRQFGRHARRTAK